MNPDLKIAVLNYSGNVGKTTLAKHLLQPRMNNCPIKFIETINSGGDDTNIKGKEFASVMADVLAEDCAIVDIGSSNIEQVFAKVSLMGDILEGFDFFLIPTVPLDKQQEDTVKMIRALIALGVPESKMKLVFNQADPEDNVEKKFALAKRAADSLGITTAVVHSNLGFAHLGTRSIADCVAADKDFRAEISAAPTKELKHELATAQVLSRLASSIQRELDAVFLALFGSSRAAA